MKNNYYNKIIITASIILGTLIIFEQSLCHASKNFTDIVFFFEGRNPFEPQNKKELNIVEPVLTTSPIKTIDTEQKTIEPKIKPQTNIYQPPIEPYFQPIVPSTQDSTQNINPGQYTISGLIWNSDRPQAIINNQIFSVGDKINDQIKIVSIKKTGVDVELNGQITKLSP